MSTRASLGGWLAALAVALVVVGGAQAKLTNHRIVPGKSIGVISIGMTRAEVEHRLGHGRLSQAKGTTGEFWLHLGLGFFFKGYSRSARVLTGLTNNVAYETPQGIRVTSTTAEVEQAYSSLHCRPSNDSNPDRPWKNCTHRGPGGGLTEFLFYKSGHGDVTGIAIGDSSLAALA